MVAVLVGLLYLDDQLGRIDVSGTFLAPLLGDQSHLPPGVVLLGLILCLAGFGAYEWGRMVGAAGIRADPLIVTLSSWTGCLFFFFLPGHNTSATATFYIAASVVTGFVLLAVVRFAWRGTPHGAMASIGSTTFAMVYLGVLPGFYLAIRRDHSPWLIAAVVLITKSCDIGAFFTGRAIGRRQLIAWLSPGKTWEGLAGGVMTSGLVAVGFVAVAGQVDPSYSTDGFPYSLWFAVAGGACLGAVGQAGDLLESLLKRDAGIKDSAATIPGFGGVLDVCDSLMLVAPLAYGLTLLATKWGLV